MPLDADIKKLVVLVSGSGSNLQALIDQCHNAADCPAEIQAVISDKPDAYGLERAKQAGIAAIALPKQAGEARSDYDRRLMGEVTKYKPDFVLLAGFMRILSAEFVAGFENRLVNIHPSLLPDYKGLNTHQRVLDDGRDFHGCTVHLVTPTLDDGPALVQARLAVKAGEGAEKLAARVLAWEHEAYPTAIKLLLSGDIYMENGKLTHKGGQPLPLLLGESP